MARIIFLVFWYLRSVCFKLSIYFASYTFLQFSNRIKKQIARAVIVWWLDLQLPMQPVPITTDVVDSTVAQARGTT